MVLTLRIAWFLALRAVRRANLWTTGLIVFVMLLTFLNLIVVNGFLVGIVDGISDLFRKQETGDVIISTPKDKNYIEHSAEIVGLVKGLPQVKNYSSRYISSGSLEANYKTRTDPNEKPNKTGAELRGIDPIAENNFSGIASFVGEGSYLSPDDYDKILIGSQLIDRYSFGGDIPGLTALHNVYPGTVVRVTVGSTTREMMVKGILVTSANSPLATAVFLPQNELRELIGRDDFNVNQIAIRLNDGVDPASFRDLLVRNGVSSVAQVKTFEDSIPNGVAEVRATFSQIGTAIGSIGLVVASITIFIVIFINAVTRRKYIGIMKGIGIHSGAIELAYVLQSLFYVIIGSALGLSILYGFLVPYVAAHPIVLPFSNAIIVAPPFDTLVRIGLLALATAVAGYIPARMIVKRNTLDSILGRN